MKKYGIPPADMLINDVSKLFDDSIRRKSISYPTYEHFGGKRGLGQGIYCSVLLSAKARE